MGLLDSILGGGSSSASTDQRFDASGAEALAQHGNGAQARDKGIALGNGAQLNLGTDLRGSRGSKYVAPGGRSLENVKIGDGGSLSIYEADPNLIKAISDQAVNTSTTLGQYLDKVNTEIKDLAEEKITQGQAGENRTVLFVVLGMLAAAVLIVFFWRRQ